MALQLGCHISKNISYLHSIETEHERMSKYGITMNCIQLFATGPRSYLHNMNDELINEIKKIKYLKAEKTNVVIHGGYYDHPWNETLNPQIVKNINFELEVNKKMDGLGVILHLPKKPINVIIEGIKKLNLISKIILEMESYHATENTYETPAKLHKLISELDSKGFKDVGVCIDTAHLHSAGVDIRSYDNSQKYIDELKYKLNIPTIIHFNDQKFAFESGRDHHMPLTYGTIWNEYNPDTGSKKLIDSGIIPFLKFGMEPNNKIILERSSEDIIKDYTILNLISSKI